MIRLAIAVGGVVGALARFGVGQALAAWTGSAFPWPTLLINLSGSLLLGTLMQTLPLMTVSAATRAGLTVGLCGGFTTFSTFSFETVSLLQRGAWAPAILYAGASAAGAMAGVVIGMAGGARLFQRRLASATGAAETAAPAPRLVTSRARDGERAG